MMHETNHFVRKFKTIKELADEQSNGIEDVRMSQLLSYEINRFKVVCDHKYYGIIPFLLLLQEFCGAIDKAQHRRLIFSLQEPKELLETTDKIANKLVQQIQLLKRKSRLRKERTIPDERILIVQ
ncbi:hypothetical protein PS15p_205657 [Mucor circinelloides]